MARVEKHFNQQGELTWAKGFARDIYKDKSVLESRCLGFRVSEEKRWYNLLMPIHTAGSIIGKNQDHVLANLPPYKDWRFVLVGCGGYR